MGSDDWDLMPFAQAVQVNPSVPLTRGSVYPFVDMQTVNPTSRSVEPSEIRVFTGGGSRFAVGDTLMARITPCLENGKIARYMPKSDQDVAHGSTEFIVIRGRPGITINDFAYYLTKCDTVRMYCISQMTGSSGRQRVPTSVLNYLEVHIPPLPEQRAIAHILGALDDKIELNRQMNQTLEGIARALFKSWFVDFDPVRAKAAGEQPPGLAPHIADLFPDEFVESELGEIPKGWEVGSILEFANLLSGGTPKTSETSYWNGSIAWVSAKDVSNVAGVFLLDTERKITQAGVDNSNTKLLPAKTTIITARGTVGAHCLLGQPMTMNQTNYGLKAKESVGDYFVYFSLKNLVERLRQQSYGTIFDTITTQTFQNTVCIYPPHSLIGKFEELLLPIMDAILNNQRQSRTLAALRDTLLPKLISGELRVPGEFLQD
jgi:type I restriction enzyme S subunit